MNISHVSTNQLVEELQNREAVGAVFVKPYEDCRITVGNREIADRGPVVILRVWD